MPQKETIVFQLSIFRGEPLNFPVVGVLRGRDLKKQKKLNISNGWYCKMNFPTFLGVFFSANFLGW